MTMADDFSVMATSMQADLHKINAASQNIANVNTPAYKRQVSFSEFLDQSAQIESTTIIDTSKGSLKLSKGNYDVAITGDGYFLLQNENKQVITRSGQFSVDPEGYLVGANDFRVQGINGDMFIGNEPINISQNGDIKIGNEHLATFRIIHLNQNAKLSPAHLNTYNFSPDSMVQSDTQQTLIHQGYLENSNVDAREEMLSLVKTMRHFELQQKVLRSYNSMIDVGISDLGDF